MVPLNKHLLIYFSPVIFRSTLGFIIPSILLLTKIEQKLCNEGKIEWIAEERGELSISEGKKEDLIIMEYEEWVVGSLLVLITYD